MVGGTGTVGGSDPAVTFPWEAPTLAPLGGWTAAGAVLAEVRSVLDTALARSAGGIQEVGGPNRTLPGALGSANIFGDACAIFKT